MMTIHLDILRKYMALPKVISKLVYPVYKLGSGYSKVYRDGAKIVVENKYGNILVLDDCSLPGATLALRRLQSNDKLFKLESALFELKDVVLSSNKQYGKFAHFIDSNGTVFHIEKTDFHKVRTYEIEDYKPVDGGYSVRLKYINQRFICRTAPTDLEKFIFLLWYANGYIPLGYSEELKEDYLLKI